MAACAVSGARSTLVVDGMPAAGFQSDLTDCQTLAAGIAGTVDVDERREAISIECLNGCGHQLGTKAK